MNADLVIILTAILVSTASALVGSFLVLRRMALLSDAISHAVLPGIVLAYWLSGGERATVPALLGAAAAGLVTVVLVEWLTRTGKVKNDAAIGIVFPALFSLGVLAVSLFFRNVHLDMDAVLYGEIAYAPFNTLNLWGREVPESWLVMGSLTLLNLLFVLLFYKELKLSTFDPGLAAALGLAPGALHYGLMTLVSFTSVGAFQSVGAILIVAFLIIPPATAYLLTRRLPVMIALAVGVGVVSSLAGYALAIWLDASIAGMMATVAGLCFTLAFLFSPVEGYLTARLRRERQRLEVAARLLVAHLAHHDQPVPEGEVLEEFGWNPRFLKQVREKARQAGWLEVVREGLRPTARGLAMSSALLEPDP
ncbi:metal ABC transporter permease [Meiothermus ruber]|jgi:manganese/zinc/iron transport system permease protein|uniref:ABC transporter n=1 Tax=Meiothermus ruber (strain ATCC 35948 / DSM 1279 / VKM B-1258 / 21) TaxID=504728 RepID=D3PNJ8_MEIRD|nr:metal ABC transporter permease [Meiothermus ruber]ADD27389.1 ABC-3 protein [Meiothermus ruber DSM 1279]AGK03854.1 ABC transporter [Meiothermus ruber DSM 1279]MCL6531033.1 metal ABC transporter permease [Meiothermus ruber]GAO74316.1 ABC transporter [Meiothermus ruber H328]